MAEGYYFNGIENTINNELDEGFRAAGEFNSETIVGSIKYKRNFYEVEEDFNEKIFEDIYLHITTNNNINNIENQLQITSSEDSIIINSLKISQYVRY